jgi:hypothetical protein
MAQVEKPINTTARALKKKDHLNFSQTKPKTKQIIECQKIIKASGIMA